MTLITKKALADLAGVKPPTITYLSKPGRPLADAVVRRKIDLDHPSVVAYLDHRSQCDPGSNMPRDKVSKTSKPKTPTPAPQPGDEEAPGVHPTELVGAGLRGRRGRGQSAKADLAAVDRFVDEATNGGEDVDQREALRRILDMPLSAILAQYGSHASFQDWLKSSLTLEQLQERRLKNRKAAGELVPREYVERGILAPFESVFNQMLNDAPPTISARTRAKFEAGASVEEVESWVRGIIERYIKDAKQQASAALESLKSEA